MIKLFLESVAQALALFSPILVYIAWRLGVAAAEDVIQFIQGCYSIYTKERETQNMVKTVLIILGALLAIFACGIVYGLVEQAFDRLRIENRTLASRCEVLRGENQQLARENTRLKRRYDIQCDRNGKLNAELVTAQINVKQLQSQAKAQQRKLVAVDKLLSVQAKGGNGYES